jgi:hypothetical protein
MKTSKTSKIFCVATLNSGWWPKQGLARMRDKREAREAHLILLGVQESVREWTLTLPNELPLWELESWWSPKFSESNFRGQNPLNWRLPYITRKLLKFRCLKWACMIHLDT